MNLISCDQRCRYQKDGYCVREGTTNITGSPDDGCLFYERETDDGQQNGGPESSGPPPAIL